MGRTTHTHWKSESQQHEDINGPGVMYLSTALHRNSLSANLLEVRHGIWNVNLPTGILEGGLTSPNCNQFTKIYKQMWDTAMHQIHPKPGTYLLGHLQADVGQGTAPNPPQTGLVLLRLTQQHCKHRSSRGSSKWAWHIEERSIRPMNIIDFRHMELASIAFFYYQQVYPPKKIGTQLMTEKQNSVRARLSLVHHQTSEQKVNHPAVVMC